MFRLMLAVLFLFSAHTCASISMAVGEGNAANPSPEPRKAVDFRKLQAVTVKTLAAATNYRLKIESIYRVEDELWVVARVSRTKDEVGGAAITKLGDSVYIQPHDEPVKARIVGKQWVWQKNNKTTEYVKDEKALMRLLKKKGTKVKHLRMPGQSPTSKIGDDLPTRPAPKDADVRSGRRL